MLTRSHARATRGKRASLLAFLVLICTAGVSTPAAAAPGALDVLIVHTDDPTTLRGQILARPGVGAVDVYHARPSTPSLAVMQPYDLVVVFSNFTFGNATQLGDRLADYADGGGRVVTLNFSNQDGWALAGRWANEGYSPYSVGYQSIFSSATLGAHDAAHPLMQGVAQLASTYRTGVHPMLGATEVARWSDGVSLVATKNGAVAINAYVGDHSGGWSGDFGTLIVNASNLGATPADVTAPAITPTISGTLGDGGWYTSDVDLSWSVVDAESAITSSVGCDAVTVTADQDSTDYTCSATSGGGSGSQTVSLKRDATDPIVGVTGVANGAAYFTGSAPAAGCDTQDTTSGVANAATLSETGGSVGPRTATCAGARDNAGNVADAVASSYSIVYEFAGFFRPVDGDGVLNAVKAGSAVPVKFSLAGDRGLAILATGSPSSQKMACESGAVVGAVEETATAGSSSLSYDASTDRYIYVWKTDKAWAPSCRQLKVTLTDGTSHTANFKFTK